VVYIFNPTEYGTYTFDLCESTYDTKIWVWNPLLELMGCNDDFCEDSQGHPYLSYLEITDLPAGVYYIIIDGYGGEEGDYRLIVGGGGSFDYSSCQPPSEPCDSWTAGTSHNNFDDADHYRAERFGEAGQIYGFQFWGLSLYYDNGWDHCAVFPMDFEIAFYEEEGLGVPGELVYSEETSLTGVSTGVEYAGYLLYEFHFDLDSPVNLVDGWLGIQSYGAAPACWFLWLSSNEGDEHSYYEQAGEPVYFDYDLSYCLNLIESVAETGLPNTYSLSQNYPNPFNPTTTIEFTLPRPERVTLAVYNLLGERVEELVDEVRAAGCYAVQFDATGLVSGLYFYRMRAGEFVETRKMMLVR